MFSGSSYGLIQRQVNLEGYAAIRAAKANLLQSSLKLTLGSTLASIGLSIPTIAAIAILFNLALSLGITALNTATVPHFFHWGISPN